MKIDLKLITDNLVELLTNTINVSSLFKKIFYDPTPETQIPLTQWVYDEVQDKMIPQVTYVSNVAAIKEELENHVGAKTSVLSQSDYDSIEKKADVLYFILDEE